jgi:thiaminase/transcriptional activator TenA
MKHQDLINACHQEWHTYTQHEFIQHLAKGTLAPACYLHYLKQDFLFLKQYARAYALAIYKADSLADMRTALTSVTALLASEINHHLDYCSTWGVTESDLEAEDEDFGTVAYTRYVMDAGMKGNIVDLYVALAPCFIGYAEIGRNLAENACTERQGNPFESWIKLYSGAQFQQGVMQSAEHIDKLLADIDCQSQRGQDLIKIFRTAIQMEITFWQQALNAISQEDG